jgi:hypothetical protein
MRRLALVAALSLLAACSEPTPLELSQKADASLRAGNYDQARKEAEDGLKATEGQDIPRNVLWTLERVRIEALASGGHLAEVLTSLTRLDAPYEDLLTADFYAKLGTELAQAGDSLEALELVELGKQKFPEMAAAFDGLVEDIKKKAEASDDPELTAKLKQLGYL